MSPFALTATTLIGMGYSPMPVAPRCEPLFEGHKPPSGKEPGRLDLRADGEDRWVRLKGWTTFCTRQANPLTIAHWSRMPDAGVCVATGYGGLVAIDVDDDALIDSILEVLPNALVGKFGKRGATYFFRTTEQLPSKNYKDAGGRGLLDLLADGRQSVIPGTFHPDIGRPYEWTTERTLLNTPLEDLPAFTNEHRAKMEEVLRQHGWDAPEPALPRREAVERPVRSASDDMLWHDDVNTVALANLSAWVPELGLPKTRQHGVGYRAVAPWRTSGSGRADAQRNTNLSFHPTGIFDFGDRGWTAIKVVAKARGIPYPAAAAWLRQQLGLPDERLILLNASKSGAIQPTYPDRTVSLADATTELRDVLDEFGAQMKAWRVYRNQSRIKPPLIDRKPPVWGVKIETSGGKTHEATRKVAAWSHRGWRLAYVVPRIDLADQVARSLTGHGVKTQVYRGREQDDPAMPDAQMCRNLPAANAAIALGLSVRPAVCARGIDGKLVHCPFFDVCGHEKQRAAAPDVWIITASSLLYEKPDFIAELDGLVIDEKFHDSAIAEPQTVDVAALLTSKIEFCDDEETDFLTSLRHRLLDAVLTNGPGPLSCEVLYDHKIFTDDALQASYLEQRRVSAKILRPDMRESELKTVAHRHAAKNRLARAAGALWKEIAMFLVFDHGRSGRLVVAGSELTLTPLRSFHPSWLAPVLALDATLTSPGILAAAVFGDEVVGVPSTVTMKADITIKWPDHVRVRQILDAPVSMGALGIGEHAKPRPHNERDIVRFIHRSAALAAPADIGVISYLGLRKRIEGQLPENVKWMHFGATSGLNDFENVAGLIVIGRWWNAPAKVESQASIFAGYPVPPLGEFYRKHTGSIRMTDGSTIPATVESHLDPFAEAVRRGITEDELSQAIGRLRAPRRGAACFLDIVGDVVLPVTAHEVVRWDDICPRAEADMMAKGVVLANSRDAMAVFGLTKWDAEHAETAPESLIRNHIKQTRAVPPVRGFTYRKAGTRGPASIGYYFPGVLPGGEQALRAWLEDRLGTPLASLKIERVQSRANFAKIGADTAER